VRPSSAIDAGSPALAAAVRAVLDDRRFRDLEAAWRGLHGLVTAVESDGDAEIWVLDVGPGDAPAALAEELAVEGAPPLAAIVAAFRYGPDDGALATLAGLAAVAQAVAVPVIADVDPRVLGLRDARELGSSDAVARIGMLDHWRRFRRHALASHVVLCLPRVLARLPYGPQGEPVTSFRFDEGLGAADHERFLWGSAALGLGAVLLRAFAAEGRELRIERHAELAGLPVYVVREPDGDRRAIPCAEVVMSASTIRALVDQGCTVLASVRDEDRATFWGIGMLDGSPFPPLG
jgi:type VI secretion system protein ImpC